MGNAGKVEQRARARALRAESWTLKEIADELAVSKSSVSLWVRDVDFVPQPRTRGHLSHRPHPLRLRRLADIERGRTEGRRLVGPLSERDLLMAGLGLYAGDGAKSGFMVSFANSNADLIKVFCAWYRTFFPVDEDRLSLKLYLHEGLDLGAAIAFWSEITEIPASQFTKPYRAKADQSMRRSKHVHGCAHVRHSSVSNLRTILGMIEALVS